MSSHTATRPLIILAIAAALLAGVSTHASAMWSLDWFEVDPATWLFPAPAEDACCDTWVGGGGCLSSPDMADCVCSFDDYCCDTAWDAICANEVQNYCGYDCDGGPDQTACCAYAHDGGGCPGNTLMDDCVCAFDDSCCQQNWDKHCVAIATKMCSDWCGIEIDPEDDPAAPPADSPCEINPAACE